MAKFCDVCGEKASYTNKTTDGIVCSVCQQLSPNYALDGVQRLKEYYTENHSRRSAFQQTSAIKYSGKRFIRIDDNNRLIDFAVTGDNVLYYRFDEIQEYSIEAVGCKTITRSKGGVGRAVVGGLLAGGVGAIVGASTGKTETRVTSGNPVLKITLLTYCGKSTVDVWFPPAELAPFLDKCMFDEQEKQNASEYQNQSNLSTADEIIKFKGLLDQGVITQDEFESKKKLLLGGGHNTPTPPQQPQQMSQPHQQLSPQQMPPQPKKSSCLTVVIVFLVIFISVPLALVIGLKNETASAGVKVILDATKYYNEDETTVSEKQLIELLGEPDSYEDWNFKTETTSAPIRTLAYGDHRYHFNNGTLHRISIDEEIPYENKNDMLAMFGLKKHSNSVVKDTNSAYRISKCGVKGFWTQYDSEKKTMSFIKIDYSHLFSSEPN